MILYNSENKISTPIPNKLSSCSQCLNVHDIGQFCRSFFFHSSDVKYTSSLTVVKVCLLRMNTQHLRQILSWPCYFAIAYVFFCFILYLHGYSLLIFLVKCMFIQAYKALSPDSDFNVTFSVSIDKNKPSIILRCRLAGNNFVSGIFNTGLWKLMIAVFNSLQLKLQYYFGLTQCFSNLFVRLGHTNRFRI